MMSRNNKSKYGQFNTDLNECQFTINKIKEYVEIKGDVLEPSFGTGNFVSELKKLNVSIDALEIHKKVYKEIDGVNTIKDDFIFHKFNKKYDFIIGNPPYIELINSFYNDKRKEVLTKKFKDNIKGRHNLIHYFMDKSFDLLKDGGVLAFLLPSTILSSPWYNMMRKQIYEEYTVLDIVENIPFKEVAIDVCLLIIQKTKDEEHKNISLSDNFYVLTKNVTDVNKLTLRERGFQVNIGEILWYLDAVMPTLSDSPIGNKTLIYTNNIKKNTVEIGGKLKSKKEGKKQYIRNNNYKNIPNCIITSRVISKNMKFCLLRDNTDYVFENHVLIVTHPDITKLEELYEVFNNSSSNFKNYFNSSYLTTTELLNFSY